MLKNMPLLWEITMTVIIFMLVTLLGTFLSMPVIAYTPDDLAKSLVEVYAQHSDKTISTCTGILAKGPEGKVSVWTAGHCCAAKEGADTPNMAYRHLPDDTINMVPEIEFDSGGRDICRLTPKVKEKSIFVVGPERHDEVGKTTDIGVHMYSGMPILHNMHPNCIPVNQMVMLGIADNGDNVYNGIACHGMSGSPILTRRGVVIGVASMGWTDGEDNPIPGMQAAMFDMSMWFRDQMLNRSTSRPLPKHRK
jgi:hypothetical protein